MLGRYVRDERLVPLPEMIRRMTSGAAAQMGIVERGQIRPGWYADLVVFDPGDHPRPRDVRPPEAVP